MEGPSGLSWDKVQELLPTPLLIPIEVKVYSFLNSHGPTYQKLKTKNHDGLPKIKTFKLCHSTVTLNLVMRFGIIQGRRFWVLILLTY